MFVDFMSPKWNIERSFFAREVMGYDPKTKKDVPWPFPTNAEENDHKKWLEQVRDPVTKQFYTGKETIVEYDDDGNEIPASKKILEKQPSFTIKQIVRLRTKDKKEYLYTVGYMHGFTTYGTGVTTSFREPEIWTQRTFTHHMEYIPRENRHREVCDGPSGFITHYKLPFSSEAVDMLMKNAMHNVSLTVKEENGKVKQCTNVEMFKTQPFDYILNDEWQTPEEREKAKLAYEIMEANVAAENKKRISTAASSSPTTTVSAAPEK